MKSQGRREPGHFFPRLLQRDRSYRRKTMDTHEPPERDLGSFHSTAMAWCET